MNMAQLFNEHVEEVTELVAAGGVLVDARETAMNEGDPAKAVQLNAEASRMIHMHQTSLLAMISRQLLWIQRAMLEHLPPDGGRNGE